MQLGMIGLGRMGANMVRRLMKDGHECVVFDMFAEGGARRSSRRRRPARRRSPTSSASSRSRAPSGSWCRPRSSTRRSHDARCRCSSRATRHRRRQLVLHRRHPPRASELAPKKIHYVDVGTSGGVWGLERGYCMMIGGDDATVQRLDPIFKTLAPGRRRHRPHARAATKVGGTAEHGYLHCGPNGAGHFVKMVHNGIEYGIMAAYAEGLDILQVTPTSASRRTRSTPRPRRCATPSTTSTTSTCRTSPRCGGAAASSRRGCSTSRRRALLKDPALAQLRRARVRLRRGPLDDQGGDRRSRAGAGAHRRRCTSASARAARPTSRTSCCRRCASSSAATSRSKQRTDAMSDHDRRPHRPTRWSSSAPPATSRTRRSSRRCRR